MRRGVMVTYRDAMVNGGEKRAIACLGIVEVLDIMLDLASSFLKPASKAATACTLNSIISYRDAVRFCRVRARGGQPFPC